MKKKLIHGHSHDHLLVHKIWLTMRLIVLLFFVSLVHVSASVYSQKTKLNIKVENATLQQVFDLIQDQSEFDFFYKNEQIPTNAKVSLSAENESIESILNNILKDTGLKYGLVDKDIVIIPVESASGQQQKKTVSGKVTDPSGATLPGVSVFVKGSTNGSITDINGNYSLTNIAENAILKFSFVGMKSQDVLTGKNTIINVVLIEEAIGLEEVVAVGYGAMKKRDVTGATISIKGKELTALPIQRVDQALQGQAAGVNVLSPSGAPGGDAIIRIRGINSVTGGNSALIVIDGFQGGSLSSLNPNDVESIEVLKDASATAIYGSQGANGVVLVTTKKGKKGKPMIEYGLIYGIQKIRHKFDLMNAGDYARSQNMHRATLDASGAPTPIFSDAQIAAFDKNGGTDWQDLIFRTAPLKNHQLTVSGASDHMSYLVSAGLLDQEGLLLNSSYKRYSIRANLSADITKSIRFDFYSSTTIEGGNVPPVGDYSGWLGAALNSVLVFNPTTTPYDANGNYSKAPAGFGAYDSWNPLAAAKEPQIHNSTTQNNIGANLDFIILKDLKFRIIGGAYISNVKNKSYYNANTFEGQPGALGVGVAKYNNTLGYNLQNSNILTYDHMFGKIHHLVVTGVQENQYSNYQSTNLTALGFAVDLTGADALGGASSLSGSSPFTERVLRSYLGRINYSYADKYLATVTYRADASSVFGPNNKWGYFPSLSLAWRLAEEPFIKKLKLFSALKLRGSYGITGNQGIAPYQTLANMTNNFSGNNYGNANYPYNGGPATGNSSVGMIQANSANPNLKWESTKQSNIGIDFSIFNGRLTATAEYYKKVTSDLLLDKAMPMYTGFSTVLANVGSIENKGTEFTIGGDPIVGKFKWNTNFNISFNKNTVLDLGGKPEVDFTATNGGYQVDGYLMQLRVGGSFGDMYGYKTLGIWKTSEADKAAKFGTIPGTVHWDDPNNDGKIDINDIVKIGNSQPKYIFGWNNLFTYGNFDLNVFVQGTYGNQVFNMARIRMEGQSAGTSKALLNSWTTTNQNTDSPGYIKASTWATFTGLISTNTISNSSDAQRISRWVEDASYIRIKNIVLGYSLPASLLGKYGISRIKFSVSATNMFTFTKYKGFDPEVSSFNGNDAQRGVDYNNYPSAKTISFGVNLTF